MNAEEYATAYAAQEALQDNDDWEFGVQIEYPQPTLPVKLTSEAKAAIASLQNVPLLDGRALPEVWSEDFQLPFPRYRGILRADKPEPLLEDEKDSTSIATPNAIPIVSLLSELALRLVLSQPLDHHSIETLRSMMWLPGKVEAFFEAFRSPQFAPIPDSALALLVDAIGLTYDEDTMNLSRICLSDEQILSLALNAPGVQTLKLSHNPSVSIRTVQAVLTSLPHIKRLVLLNTTISKQEWVSLLQEHPPLFYNLDALVHPCFLDADYGTFPDALTIIGSDEVAIRAKTIPFFSNDTLIQVLSTYLRTLARTLINGSAGTISSTILSADILKPGQTWGSRSISAFAQGNSLPFKGNGWIFIVCTARYQFGFAKVTRKIPNTRKPEASLKDSMAASPADEDLTCDVHDITSFLSELEKEGRPPMPEDAAKRLFDLFANADQRGSFGKNTKLKLISVETANDIVRGKIIEDWPFGIIAREVLPETSTHVDLP